jgi:heme/copper-type cytochrome/quinol oxidase subunit 2
MKTTMGSLIFVLLAVSGTALLVSNADAEISMPERENVQTIVRVIEFVTFVTAVAIAWFIWRISKRASKIKKSRQVKP